MCIYVSWQLLVLESFITLKLTALSLAKRNMRKIKSKKNGLHSNKIFEEDRYEQKEKSTLPKDMKTSNCHS